jgi:hypothetical protein
VLDRVTDAITAGMPAVPIAAAFRIEQSREAVTLQRWGHVHVTVVIKKV